VAPGDEVIAGVAAAVEELWNVAGANELCGDVDGSGVRDAEAPGSVIRGFVPVEEGVLEVDVLSVLMSVLFGDVVDEVEEEGGGEGDVAGGVEDGDKSSAELSRREY
jgi:hypothetical protein